MSNLGPQQQNVSYDGLLQVDGGISSTLKPVQDGMGNMAGLWLSSTGTNALTATDFVASVNGTPITGALPRPISDGFGDYVSVKDFGAVGDGITDDTVAIQNAINECLSVNRALKITGGTYKTTATLNISGSLILFGDSRLNTRINYSGAGSAILATNWTGSAQSFSVFVSQTSANGFEITAVSRNASLRDIYFDATAIGSTTTGAGILLSTLPASAFSGGLEIRGCYALQFKYGVKMVGIDMGNTWTTVEIYNSFFVGNSAGVVSGSCGIYMDANTNGIGTSMYGGDIESFSTGVYVAEGSFGGIFEADFEGNVTDYSIGTTFVGRIVTAQNIPRRDKSSNAGSSGLPWWQTSIANGGIYQHESYYSPTYLTYDGSSSLQPINYYRNGTSIINGGSLSSNALKFSIGMGQTGSYGVSVHPSDHYISICDRKISFGPQSPDARAGSQIVAWVQGSVCYNSAATVGQPIGWICTVSGTPGTWVAMANL